MDTPADTLAPGRRVSLERFRRCPWWITLLWLFCLYMTVVYLPFDIFLKPVAADREVWFGVVLSGWWAKATEPCRVHKPTCSSRSKLIFVQQAAETIPSNHR